MPTWDSKVYELMQQLECIKCGSRENLIPFACSYSKVTGSKRRGRTTTTYYNVHSVAVPVCYQCNKEFKEWGSTRTLIICLMAIGFIAFWLGITFFIVNSALGGNEPMDLQIFGIVIGVILLAIGIPLYLLHKKKDTNLNNYMKMGADLVPFIKFSNSWVKYENWARKIINQQYMPVRDPEFEVGKNLHFCQNCGLKNPVKAKFCTDCGFKIQ